MKNLTPISERKSVIQATATGLLILGCLALITLLLQLVGTFFVPLIVAATVLCGGWWVLRKSKGVGEVARQVEANKQTARAILSEGARITGKAIRTAAAITKAIREEVRRGK